MTSNAVMSISKFERFFRVAAGLDVDKSDLKRFTTFVNSKVYDLLLRAEAIAKANARDVICPMDLPITKGMQENIQNFRKLDQEIQLDRMLNRVTAVPELKLRLSDEADAELPDVAGGLGVALARTFRVIDPTLEHPHAEHWTRSFQLFDLLL
jgi:hypothetical protein